MTDELESMLLDGRVEPPKANGEVIFDEPWQNRTFCMARSLCEAGHYTWDEFRACLIQQIESWQADHSEQEPYQYFDHFLAALTDLMELKGLCETRELDQRSRAFADRPHGHDH